MTEITEKDNIEGLGLENLLKKLYSVSLYYKKQVDMSKTNIKKKLYRQKLKKHNEMLANILMTMQARKDNLKKTGILLNEAGEPLIINN